jgi:hypothetical protein
MIFKFILYAIVANGLFNVLVSASILKYVNFPEVRDFYVSLFSGGHSPIFERVLAYYSFINGLVRTVGGMNLYQQSAANLVALSYFSEASFLANELYTHKTMDKTHGQYAIGFCVIMGSLALYNYFY